MPWISYALIWASSSCPTVRGRGRLAPAAHPVSDCQQPAKIVRGMAPFRGQPGVVIVQPADHGADVECAPARGPARRPFPAPWLQETSPPRPRRAQSLSAFRETSAQALRSPGCPRGSRTPHPGPRRSRLDAARRNLRSRREAGRCPASLISPRPPQAGRTPGARDRYIG